MKFDFYYLWLVLITNMLELFFWKIITITITLILGSFWYYNRINNTFQKSSDQSGCKPNKIWIDKGSEICKRSMKLWLQDNDTGINSTNSKGQSVVVKRFVTTLRNKIYKYQKMTTVSKNVYIDKLDDYSWQTQQHIF